MSKQKSSTAMRALQVILGIAAFILAFVVLFYPGFGLATLIAIFSFGLAIGGLMLVADSLVDPNQSGIIRAIGVIIGMIAVVISVAVVVYPGLGTATLIIILSIAVIAAGFGIIFKALTEKQSGLIKGLSSVIGLAVIGLGIGSLFYPGLASATLLVLLSIALLMIGTTGIMKGLTGE